MKQSPWYSAALCRGLIEANVATRFIAFLKGIPRLYAAASLKRVVDVFHVVQVDCMVFRGFMPRPH